MNNPRSFTNKTNRLCKKKKNINSWDFLFNYSTSNQAHSLVFFSITISFIVTYTSFFNRYKLFTVYSNTSNTFKHFNQLVSKNILPAFAVTRFDRSLLQCTYSFMFFIRLLEEEIRKRRFMGDFMGDF